MNRGIVSIGEIIGLKKIPVIVEEQKITAPKPKAPRVVGDPTREPVNLQAALMCAKASWIHHPPLPAEDPPKPKIELLMRENSDLKTVNKNIIAENAALKRKIESLEKRLAQKNETRKIQVTIKPIEAAPSKKQLLLERLASC